jgi:hypothetical protein
MDLNTSMFTAMELKDNIFSLTTSHLKTEKSYRDSGMVLREIESSLGLEASGSVLKQSHVFPTSRLWHLDGKYSQSSVLVYSIRLLSLLTALKLMVQLLVPS